MLLVYLHISVSGHSRMWPLQLQQPSFPRGGYCHFQSMVGSMAMLATAPHLRACGRFTAFARDLVRRPQGIARI